PYPPQPYLFFPAALAPRDPPSFPTRRSSDLGFAAAHLAQHDAIRPHTKSIDHQFALTHCAFALDVRRTAFHSDDMRLLHVVRMRSEEHTSELQSRSDLVCRLLLEKKKKHAAK